MPFMPYFMLKTPVYLDNGSLSRYPASHDNAPVSPTR